MRGTSKLGRAAPIRRLRAPNLLTSSRPISTTTTTTTTTSSTSSCSATRLLTAAAGGDNRKSRSFRVVPSAASPSGAASAGGGGSAGAGDGESEKPSLFSKLKSIFSGEKLDRERLKALGTGAVASYGAVSNITYGGGMAVSWVGFVKKFGVSPLASGQWPKFLAFYSAFWMAQNFIRPLRFSLALAMAPAFDRFIDFLASKLNISRPKAFGVYLAILGIATSALVFGGIFLACGPAAYAR